MAATNDTCMYSRVGTASSPMLAQSTHASHRICIFGSRLDFMGIGIFDEVYIQMQTKQKPLYQQIIMSKTSFYHFHRPK